MKFVSEIKTNAVATGTLMQGTSRTTITVEAVKT